jgi:hypothetical protein
MYPVSESSVAVKWKSCWRDLVSKEGNLEFAGYQDCSGYVGCGSVVIY